MNERGIILETLLLIEQKEDFSTRIIKDVLDKYAYLDRQHRSFMKRVMEGCVERRIELDYVIDHFSKTPTVKMKPVILCICRMGVYQLLYMDSIPASAVCNEAVKLAKSKGFAGLAGFVNGVLRAIARNAGSIPYPDEKTDPIGHDRVVYSMPEELVRHIHTHYPKQAQSIMASFFKKPPMIIRINTSVCNEAQLKERLGDEICLKKLPPIEGIAKQETAYELTGYDRLENLQAFDDGLFIVQDQAAMQAVAQLDLKQGDTVLDVCAAPGGKSLQAADILCKLGGGTVTACDISDKKAALIRENTERCRFDNIRIDVQSAATRKEDYVNYADAVIADLPCSGLGTIGRKSDIKYRMTEAAMKELTGLQRQILTNISDYVKAGGTLLYSTCTLNPAENEEMAEWIKENLPFEQKSMHQIFPTEVHDGFFFAVFCKR